MNNLPFSARLRPQEGNGIPRHGPSTLPFPIFLSSIFLSTSGGKCGTDRKMEDRKMRKTGFAECWTPAPAGPSGLATESRPTLPTHHGQAGWVGTEAAVFVTTVLSRNNRPPWPVFARDSSPAPGIIRMSSTETGVVSKEISKFLGSLVPPIGRCRQPCQTYGLTHWRWRREPENIDRAIGVGGGQMAAIGGEGDGVDCSWEYPLLNRFTRCHVVKRHLLPCRHD